MPATPVAADGDISATVFRHEHFVAVMTVRQLSDAQLGRKAGLSRETVYRIRTRAVTPSMTSIAKLARALGLPFTDLVQVSA
jgi:DNA-binding phage protein